MNENYSSNDCHFSFKNRQDNNNYKKSYEKYNKDVYGCDLDIEGRLQSKSGRKSSKRFKNIFKTTAFQSNIKKIRKSLKVDDQELLYNINNNLINNNDIKDKLEDYEDKEEMFVDTKNSLNDATEEENFLENNMRVIYESIESTKQNKKKPNKNKENILLNNDSKISKIWKKIKCFNITKVLPLNFLRIFTLITVILYSITMLLSVIVFQLRKEKYPFLFCFKFLDIGDGSNESIHFLIDKNCFFIVFMYKAVVLISVCYELIKNEKASIIQFFNDFGLYFPLTLICNTPIFIISMNVRTLYTKDHWQMICFIALELISILCIIRIYIRAKTHGYKNFLSMINQSLMCGIFFAFECYCLIYSIVYLITYDAINFDYYPYSEAVANSVFFIIGILVITVFRDIFFPLTMLIIEIGLLYIKKSSNFETIIINIFILFFTFASIVLTIFKMKGKVFGLIADNE